MLQQIASASDAAKLCARRQLVEDRVPLVRLTRLLSLLADGEGEVSYSLSFSTDVVGHSCIHMRASAQLPLVCQRTLERFLLPVEIDMNLAVIKDEAEESGLMPDFEALLLGPDPLSFTDIVEDELILRVPALPLSDSRDADAPVAWEYRAPDAVNPFAVLKKKASPNE